MNMPFELGVDYGGRAYNDQLEDKKFLILETNRYDFQKAISDLAGVDIKSHNNEPQTLVRRVRNWLRSATGKDDIDGPTAIWYEFGDFEGALYDKLTDEGFSDEDINDLPVIEYIDHARSWVSGKAE